MQFLIELYFFFEKGFLPFEGTILDQPWWFVEIIKILSSIKAELEERELNKFSSKEQDFKGIYNLGNMSLR